MSDSPASGRIATGAVRPLQWAETPELADVPLQSLLAAAAARLAANGASPGRLDVRRLAEFVETSTVWLERPENRFSSVYLRQLLNTYLYFRKERPQLQGATFLEVGCGAENPLAVAMAMLLLGAERAFGVDDCPILDVGRAVRGCAKVVQTMLSDPAVLVPEGGVPPDLVLARLRGFDLARLTRGDAGGIDAARLNYRRESVQAIGLPDASCDIVCSNAVLEHVGDVGATARELARLGRPGSWSIHNIDYKDHGIYDGQVASPIAFLTEQPEASHVRTCNRVRHSAVLTAFRQAGFVLVEESVYGRREPDPATLAALLPRFASLTPDDLSITGAVVVFRLPDRETEKES